MNEEFSLEDVLIPVLIIMPLGVLGVMLMPAKYTAQGTILVESQQIPTDLVRSTINAYAQERIQTIRQRVMTRNRLLEVADDYALFPRSLGLSESERVDLMRERLRVDLITTSRNRSSARDGTIAFTVSYTDQDPDKAYLVANKFMTLFLEEDVRARTAGASNTTEFFEREAARLRDAVASIEDRISEYKSQNASALPEHLNMHLDMLERSRRELNAAEASITQLEEERRFLETQLVSGVSGDNSLGAEAARLEAELARLRATYHENYPEVIAKKDELAAIRRRMAPDREIERLRDALTAAEDNLSSVESKETTDPEEIALAEKGVDAARNALSNKIAEASRRGGTDITSIQLEGRIAVIDNRIRSLKKQSDNTRAQIASLEARIAKTPEIERGLATLTRDHENIFHEYQEVLAKQQDAQLAENLEENQQAEKFSILEPALRPEEPSSPNRPKWIVLALFGALGAGTAIAFGVEMFFPTLRGRHHISQILDGHPIAVVPYIQNQNDRRLRLPFVNKTRHSAKTAPEPVS